MSHLTGHEAFSLFQKETGGTEAGSKAHPCDCDFHKSRWRTTTPPVFSNIYAWKNGPLKYAKQGDQLPPGCCNHPSETSVWARKVGNARSESTADGPRVNTVTAKTGYNCSRCNSRNDYAVANCGSSYVCYECR